MEDKDAESLLRSMERRIDGAETDYHRPLYGEIDWNDRLVCIMGAKGTGKTTLMLQYLKEHPEEIDRSLYISLDALWFANHSPLEAVEWHHNHGGERLFIDAVHHFRPWQTLVKNVYDDFPKMKIVYSWSSMMRLAAGAGDLSRRQRVHVLNGLSFREYLSFEGAGDFPAVALKDVLSSHRAIAREIVAKVPVLRHFSDYLERGYYPFYKTARGGYLDRLHAIVEQTLERDWPEIDDVTLPTVKIGGRGKTFKQIAGVKDSFVAADGIETGIGNKIPLWLFGFLY